MTMVVLLAFLHLAVIASTMGQFEGSDVPVSNEHIVSDEINDMKNTIRLVREQINAMIDHRQQDYNALEESLKRAIEKNTELTVLRNEVRQLRNEMSVIKGSGSGNEAKNERLKVKWLGSAVTELRAEVAEVLGARNASEEFAQRSRMRSELDLLRGDVLQVGRGIRDLGGRLTRIEASLGTIRLDIFAVKERAGQITKICADVNSQLSTVQIEMKSSKYQQGMSSSSSSSGDENNHGLFDNNESVLGDDNRVPHHGFRGNSHRPSRHALSRFYSSAAGRRDMEERLTNLERKISVVSRKRGMLEKRVVYENQNDLRDRIVELEKNRANVEERLLNISREADGHIGKMEESIIRLFESLENIEDKFESEKSTEKRERAKLEINAAQKYAELSLTREELVNLRRTVQALSVSASKLQEKSDSQQENLIDVNRRLLNLTSLRDDVRLSPSEPFAAVERASGIMKELAYAEDDYRSMIDSLPENCDDRDGLTMIAPRGVGGGLPLLINCQKGWIVVGRRIDGTIDFDRTWNEYAAGFGPPTNEFWIGNEVLHKLTEDNCTRLGIDLTDINGTHWRAEYDYFHVDSANTGYKLSVSGYNGNATDAFAYQNGMSFSSKDRDMDTSSTDCAANYHGGWWFSNCQHANLNGRYTLGLTWYKADDNQWMAVTAAVMSVKRRDQC